MTIQKLNSNMKWVIENLPSLNLVKSSVNSIKKDGSVEDEEVLFKRKKEGVGFCDIRI